MDPAASEAPIEDVGALVVVLVVLVTALLVVLAVVLATVDVTATPPAWAKAIPPAAKATPKAIPKTMPSSWLQAPFITQAWPIKDPAWPAAAEIAIPTRVRLKYVPTYDVTNAITITIAACVTPSQIKSLMLSSSPVSWKAGSSLDRSTHTFPHTKALAASETGSYASFVSLSTLGAKTYPLSLETNSSLDKEASLPISLKWTFFSSMSKTVTKCSFVKFAINGVWSLSASCGAILITSTSRP